MYSGLNETTYYKKLNVNEFRTCNGCSYNNNNNNNMPGEDWY